VSESIASSLSSLHRLPGARRPPPRPPPPPPPPPPSSSRGGPAAASSAASDGSRRFSYHGGGRGGAAATSSTSARQPQYANVCMLNEINSFRHMDSDVDLATASAAEQLHQQLGQPGASSARQSVPHSRSANHLQLTPRHAVMTPLME
uniref:Pecanex-like protein n=1 Tax=Macrostomum lignano TaxID=282301 RepID=A0A1I8H8S1_9PLAT